MSLVTRVSLFTVDIMLWPNTILRKFCTFLFCSKSYRFMSKLPSIINSFLICHWLLVFYLSVFKILFCHQLVAYMLNLELFLNFSFVISRHNDSMGSQFIDRSCLVLQQSDSFVKRHTPIHLRYCLY